MKELSMHLCRLLQSHDCVTLPGFGAFIAETASAYYVEEDNTFMPPQRSLIFSPSLTHNDGILAQSYARRNALSFARARQAVDHDIALLRIALEKDGSVLLPGIGTLERNAASKTTPAFHPAADGVVNTRYEGLPKVVCPRPLEAEEPQTPVMLEPETPGRSAWSIMGRVAALVAIILTIGFFATIPSSNSVENVHNDYAAIGFSVPSSNKAKSLAETKKKLPATPHPELCIALPCEEKASQIEEDAEGDVYLIVASLQTQKQAERFIASSGDPKLRILNSQGHYRVYAGRYATANKAYHARANCSYRDAWVFDNSAH